MEKQNNLPIKDWATEDRPREKMAAKGAGALSKAELLAILIGSGTPEKSAVALMQEVMKSCGDSLKVLGAYSAHELQAFKGIGPAKAITILAAMELVKRRMTEETDEKKKICSSTDIYDIMLPEMKERGKVVKKLAAEYGLTFIPMQTIFNNALKKAPAEFWLKDGVHPTTEGFQLIADSWIKYTKDLI